RITGMKPKLIDYNIEAVSEGKDAIGVVKIIVKSNGMEVMGSGISTDIIEASIKSYLDALNRIVIFKSNNTFKDPLKE
ncbi:MAG: 2-isopropylmalate synthase, partial [Actinobacteria bacterium]|nr:2-isopropylmalate synthase [Actinomycetota bacterium]